MFWSDPTSRFSLTLRRLKSRFGWVSPGVTVRMAWPWYWRVASVIVLSISSLVLAAWIYDAWRGFSGFPSSGSEQELSILREQVAALQQELADARVTANTSVSQLQIEKTTQDQLLQQVKKIEDENVRMKSDLAMFESFLGNDQSPGGMAISRFRVEPYGEPGKFSYHLLVTQQGKDKGREFRGRLHFAIRARQGDQTVMIDYPDKDGSDSASFLVSFKFFTRLDGVFKIPANVTPVSVEVQLVESGSIRVRQSISF
jgi:hypothetical protein